MYLSKREQAMAFAQKQGYDAYPYGQLPLVYQGEMAKHLKIAWEAGYEQHKQENHWAYGGY